MKKGTASFTQTVEVEVGKTYEYKFVVDEEWKFDSLTATVKDALGNTNNSITAA